jgi:soluble lytic murein transglycosylase-like protein
MTVNTGSFDPARSVYGPTAGGIGDRWKQVLLLVAGLIVAGQGVRWLTGWSLPSRWSPRAALAAPAAEAELTFAAQGLGTVTRDAELRSIPAGGELLASVPKGSPVTVGGVVNVPTGLRTREVYWVRLGQNGGGASASDPGSGPYGFLAAGSVTLSSGTPPRLALRGVPQEALSQPASALSLGGDAAERAAAGAGDQALSSGGPAAGPMGAGVPGDLDIAWLPATIGAWRPQILAAAELHRVDPALIALVMLAESGGNPRAQSPSGAVGLMQVMPSTGAGIAQERGIAGYTPEQLWEPATNIDFGAYYLGQQLKAFGTREDPDWQQSVELAASAYNGGPGSVQRLLAGGALPNETTRYRQWVGGMWRERGQAASATFDTWSAAGGAALVAAAQRELASRQ